MSEQLYDISLDDTGYSEPFTIEDFWREMYWCTLGFDGKLDIFWNTLKRESKPLSYSRDALLFEESPYSEFVRQERQEYKFNHA